MPCSHENIAAVIAAQGISHSRVGFVTTLLAIRKAIGLVKGLQL